MAAESPEPKERRPIADVLERLFEERVRAALAGLKVPRRDDLKALETRIEAAAARLEQLEKENA